MLACQICCSYMVFVFFFFCPSLFAVVNGMCLFFFSLSDHLKIAFPSYYDFKTSFHFYWYLIHPISHRMLNDQIAFAFNEINKKKIWTMEKKNSQLRKNNYVSSSLLTRSRLNRSFQCKPFLKCKHTKNNNNDDSIIFEWKKTHKKAATNCNPP